MKHLLAYVFLFLITAITLTQPAKAQQQIDTEKLDRFFTQLEENNRFMGSIAVLSGDEIVFEEAYGIISSDGIPATQESVYRIGSITKSYTAVMIMQLIEQGKLSLSTTLDTFFPDVPNADRITIEQLLRHKSGIVNITNLPDYTTYFTEETSREEMLNRIQSAGTSFEPGGNTEYSNSGYILLGYIIEDISGQSYAEALQKMIVEPLGLTSTYFGSGIDPDRNEADSFAFQQGDWQPASRTNMQIPHGAGAIVSTAEEVALFYHGLFDGKLLSVESLEQMRSFEGPFGLGLIRFPFGNRTLIGHNGGIDGYSSNAAHYAENDLTFAVLGNGINYTFNDILIGLLSISFGNEYEIPSFEERTAINPEPSELEKYTGTYSSPNFPLDIVLFVEGNNLMAQATGQGAFPLTVYNEQVMAFEQAGIELAFGNPVDGQYRGFQFTQAGQQFEFTLQEDSE